MASQSRNAGHQENPFVVRDQRADLFTNIDHETLRNGPESRLAP